MFRKVQNLVTQGLQLACALFQHGDLMRDRDVGEVGIDDLYDLIVVIGEFLKLEIKIVQPGNELCLRRLRRRKTNSSLKMRFTIKRLRLCSNPALQSICLKRIFSSVVSLKLCL